MSSYALCIKLCDRLDNINDMESLSEDKKLKTIEETKFILNGLKDVKLTKTHIKIINTIKKSLK